MRIFQGIILCLCLLTSASAANTFTIGSSAFKNNEKIPEIYTCDAGNVSPPLNWSNIPANTQSFALIMSNSETPVGMFYNWVLYNIPAEVNKLPEGMRYAPEGTVVGKNTLDETMYRGPCPLDSLLHHYVITLYALDRKLDLPDDIEIDDLLEEIENHTLQKATLKIVYRH